MMLKENIQNVVFLIQQKMFLFATFFEIVRGEYVLKLDKNLSTHVQINVFFRKKASEYDK